MSRWLFRQTVFGCGSLVEMTPFLDQGSDAGSNQLFVSRQPKSGANSLLFLNKKTLVSGAGGKVIVTN